MPSATPPDKLPDDDALLRRLRLLLRVVDCGGVGEAAREIGISQPAVSSQIKRLESDLGVSLFRRSGRRLTLSDQGAALVPVLRRGLGELSMTLNAVRDIARSRAAPLRFGFSAPQIALDAAEVFRKADPRTRLELRAANSTDLFAALDSYDLDIIMIGLPAPRAPYHCQLYQRQYMTVLVPVGHALAGHRAITLAELATEPIVLREPGSYTRALLIEAFEAAGLAPRIAFEVATREAVTEAVRRGFGLGPVLDREAPVSPDLACIPLDECRIVGDDYLACHASALHYGPVRRFLAANRHDELQARAAAAR
ncbi:MAG: LysR substrate-binding domain-containing protein [Nioella sp.]